MSDVHLDSVFEPREPVRKPGWQKALPWLGGALVVVVLIALAIAKWGVNQGTSQNTPLTKQPALDVSKVPKTVKLAPGVRRVAKRFIETAVARKNLREAYYLAGPAIRQGQTLKEWLKGDIAVVPYPVSELDFAPMKIDFSYPNETQIEVALLPKAGAKVRSIIMIMDLIRVNGKWLVNSWVPNVSPPVPIASP
jgi:hypothetical protein